MYIYIYTHTIFSSVCLCILLFLGGGKGGRDGRVVCAPTRPTHPHSKLTHTHAPLLPPPPPGGAAGGGGGGVGSPTGGWENGVPPCAKHGDKGHWL